MNLKNNKLVEQLVRSGCQDENDEELNRQIVVINLFALVGLTITLVLGYRALAAGDWSLALSLFISTSLFGISRLILLFSRFQYREVTAKLLLLICLTMLMLYLVIAGGKSNTGPLWMFVLPPVAMFFCGVRYGLIFIGLFTLLVGSLLLVENQLLLTSYPYDFKLRLIYSFLTVTFLSAFYEYSRQNSYVALKEISEKLEQQAIRDPLTQLFNRRGIHQILQSELARANRQQYPVALILSDVDRFKQINDKFGHNCGDEILKGIAKHFSESLRQQDSVARWGGEEFLFILPQTSLNNAVYLADRIRETLTQCEFIFEGQRHQTSASFGVTVINNNMDVDKALSRVDKALYEAKHQGRNQVKAADPASE